MARMRWGAVCIAALLIAPIHADDAGVWRSPPVATAPAVLRAPAEAAVTESSLQTDVIERPQAIAVVAVATRPNASLGRLMGEEIERPNKNGKPGVWVLVLLGVFLIAAITYRRGGSLTG